mgnify:CR=1 FL=1
MQLCCSFLFVKGCFKMRFQRTKYDLKIARAFSLPLSIQARKELNLWWISLKTITKKCWLSKWNILKYTKLLSNFCNVIKMISWYFFYSFKQLSSINSILNTIGKNVFSKKLFEKVTYPHYHYFRLHELFFYCFIIVLMLVATWLSCIINEIHKIASYRTYFTNL